jgi:RNA polymerase sigma factor (TIGR02999 family)
LPRPAESVTELIAQWQGGNQEALQALIPVVYQELRALAHHYLRAERPGHTLQSTALVHEAYLRLVDQSPVQIQNRAHFVGIAAKLMRQILVDYARRRRAAKRGPECKVELDKSFEGFDVAQEQGVDVLALDDALTQLSRRDAQQGRIVEMRFFGGLTVGETAEALDVSAATVKRDWTMAKAWLTREMQRGAGGKNQAVGEG